MPRFNDSDHVLEHFEALASKKMGVEFSFPKYSSAWKREKAMAKHLIKYAGGWYRACAALDFMFEHSDFAWKTRTSLSSCLKDIHAVLPLMEKAAEEKQRCKQAQETPKSEGLFWDTP